MIVRAAICLVVGLTLTTSSRAAQPYPLRWVYVSRGLHKDQDVEDIRGIVATAAGHGLNGMVLAAGLDRLDLQPAHYFKRLESIKRICDEAGVEIIPIIFSAGYGGSGRDEFPPPLRGLPEASWPSAGSLPHFLALSFPYFLRVSPGLPGKAT